MTKTLIAIDHSPSAMQAVAYAAAHFAGVKDHQIGIIHVLPNLPAMFWDEGHILSEDEKRERKKVVDKWLADQKASMEPVFRKAVEKLVASGISSGNIRSKSLSDSIDVAASILEEAKDGGYQTLVLGRRGLSPVKRFLLGSVTSKIINHGAGLRFV